MTSMPTVSKRKVKNLLALAVLSYLTQGPMHPYEMQRALRENDAARTFKLSYGALYAVVGQLERAGFIEQQETQRDGNMPERTIYRLTDAGRVEMRDWLRELVAEPQTEYPSFVAALSLIIVLPPAEVIKLLNRRIDRLATERADIRMTIDRAIASGAHPVFLVEDEYRLALMAAEVEFIKRFIQDITRPEKGWFDTWAAYHAEQPEIDRGEHQ